MGKRRLFRTRLRQFLDIFHKGIPQLINLLRIPRMIQLVKTRLRLKLIFFFCVSIAGAIVIGAFSGWLSGLFDSPRPYSYSANYYDFTGNVNEIAHRISSRSDSLQDTAKLESLLNSKTKYASERYYLTREDGTVVAKSATAPGLKINVYSILRQRLEIGRGELLEELPERDLSDMDAQGQSSSEDQDQTQSEDQVQSPSEEPPQSPTAIPQTPAVQGSNKSVSDSTKSGGDVTTGSTVEQPEAKEPPAVGKVLPDIDPELKKPRWVYLVPVTQNNFKGYLIGYINQEQHNPLPQVNYSNRNSHEFNQTVVGIATFFILFFYLTRNTLKTIEDISTTSRQIAKGDFQVRVTKHTEDELGELADHINRMVMELEVSLEKERQARQARDELITSASHDLRTPLTSMIGYLELLRHEQRSEQEKQRFIEIAYKKTQRLKSLVEDLFEFTKSSSNDLKLNKQSIDLCELFGQLLAEFEPILEQEGMVHELECAGEIIVSVDPEKMVRVFENLVTNAIRYGKEGKKIRVGVLKEEDMVSVNVTNYGTPISPEDCARIFERFYRVEKSRSEQTGGSGLGLAIAKNLVERHGGTIEVVSSEESTSFKVKLPLNQQD